MSEEESRPPVMIPCSYCKGAGRTELTGEYLVTLRALRYLGRSTTGAELGRLMGVSPTAMNNRLAWLEGAGLASSERHGRKRLYRAAESEEGRC